ncbi:Peptidase M50 family protein [Forsythia ovata]|uniref:Endopeptidase S2P n=1 Tax=Forsythia ovata TaxID=205694 RepID=A0ABD1R7J2_9LAMI
MMEWRRGRRGRSNQTFLPLRTTTHFSNTVSCWYCDFKFLSLNEPLFRFGRRHSRYLRVWFSMGIGFSLAALVGVTVVLLWELAQALLAYAGNAQLGNSVFNPFPLIHGLNISLPSIGYLCISSVISVFIHELGHALAAASEGVHMEYFAIFLAVFFPGALVAFNHASLQALPGVTTLRIYCAGIWHNAVFCAVCSLALFLLPFIFSPFYVHGESPMVMDVPPMSPLSGYLSARDIIFSLDGIRIHTAQEWMEIIALLNKQTLKDLDSYGDFRGKSRIGYCVPHSLIEESTNIQLNGNQTTCPKELMAFAYMSCLNPSTSEDRSSENNYQHIRETVQCLNAKDIVKLKRCGYGSAKAPRRSNGCLCSEAESCFTPVQLPGLAWVEITYSSPSSPECQNHRRSILPDNMNPNIRERRCLQSLVFIGDVISMAHSIRLTSYQPRWSIDFAADLPNLVEKLLTCTFHVSMILALLNSLPVFFLDGESILDAISPFPRLLNSSQVHNLQNPLFHSALGCACQIGFITHMCRAAKQLMR